MGWSYFVTTLLGEDQLGPVSNEEFVELVKSKVVKPSSRIHHPSFTKNRWVEAKKVKAFLDLRQQMANAQAAEKLKRKNVQAPPITPPSQPESPPDQPATPDASVQSEPNQSEPQGAVETKADPGVNVVAAKPLATIFQPRQYRAIAIVIVIFYVLAGMLVLAALYTVGSVIVVGLSGDREVAQGALAALLLSTPIIMAMLFGALINFTVGQILQLLLDVQENTQRTAYFTENRK